MIALSIFLLAPQLAHPQSEQIEDADKIEGLINDFTQIVKHGRTEIEIIYMGMAVSALSEMLTILLYEEEISTFLAGKSENELMEHIVHRNAMMKYAIERMNKFLISLDHCYVQMELPAALHTIDKGREIIRSQKQTFEEVQKATQLIIDLSEMYKKK